MRAIVFARWFSLRPSPMRRAPSGSTQRSKQGSCGVRLGTLALVIAAGFAAAPAAALSLGTPEVASYLGQPLLLRVPAILDDLPESGTQCLRIIGQQGGDVP